MERLCKDMNRLWSSIQWGPDGRGFLRLRIENVHGKEIDYKSFVYTDGDFIRIIDAPWYTRLENDYQWLLEDEK